MKKRSLFSTANNHSGGALQVAGSVLWEMTRKDVSQAGLSLVLSSEVYSQLPTEDVGGLGFDEVIQYDIYGLSAGSRKMRRYFDQFDTVFTLFGPLYRAKVPFKSIVGFAQPWIIYPNNEVYSRMGRFQRLSTRLKFKIQSAFFKRADVLVVELDHVKQGLVRELGIDPNKIEVIRNCVSSIFKDEERWQSIEVPDYKSGLRLGFIGRNYPHKNTDIFPEVIRALRVNHGIEAKFFVTFSESEWKTVSPDFQKSCINVGPIAPAQCPLFYQSVDAVVFPSLLECFSATPLEALAMQKPLFASDRPFNREVCGKHAHYFDPLSPETAASAIADFIAGGGAAQQDLRDAREHAFSFSSAESRAERYLSLLGVEEDTK